MTLVLLALQAQLVQRVIQELKDLKVQLVLLVLKVYKVLRGQLVQLDISAIEVLLGQLVPKVLLALLVRLDLRVHGDLLAQLDQKVPQAPLDLEDYKVQPVLEVHKVPQVILDPQAQQELLQVFFIAIVQKT